jgi:hypothetical protein
VGAAVCTDGACVPVGDSCTSGGDCASGFCVDGVCCESACDGPCQACSAARKADPASPFDGFCDPIAAGFDTDRECPLLESCNGAGACE